MIITETMTSYMTSFPEEATRFVFWENAFFNLALLVWCVGLFALGYFLAQKEFRKNREHGLKYAVQAMLDDAKDSFQSHPQHLKLHIGAFVSRQSTRLQAIEGLGKIVSKGNSGITKASHQTVKILAEGLNSGLHSGAVSGGTVINLVVNQPQTVHHGSSPNVEANAYPMAPAPMISAQSPILQVNPEFPHNGHERIFQAMNRYVETWQYGQSLLGLLIRMESQLFSAKSSRSKLISGIVSFDNNKQIENKNKLIKSEGTKK